MMLGSGSGVKGKVELRNGYEWLGMASRGKVGVRNRCEG